MEGQLIRATGRAAVEARFDSVEYRVAVMRCAAKGVEAKEAAKPIIEQVRMTIVRLAKEAGIDLAAVRSSFDVDCVERDGSRAFDGYRAVYQLSFKGSNVAMAVAVHDALTSIEGVQAPSPNFVVNDIGSAEAAAFRLACDRAKERFSSQCAALGVMSEAYEPVNWMVDNGQRRGKTLALVAVEARGQAIGLEPGMALVEQNVTISFARKRRLPASRT